MFPRLETQNPDSTELETLNPDSTELETLNPDSTEFSFERLNALL